MAEVVEHDSRVGKALLSIASAMNALVEIDGERARFAHDALKDAISELTQGEAVTAAPQGKTEGQEQ